MTMTAKIPSGMAHAIVFYARHFLCRDFSEFGASIGGSYDVVRIYWVTSQAEADEVLKNDPDGVVFNLAQYIGFQIPTHTPDRPLNYLSGLDQFVWRDRFMQRMSNDEIAHIRSGMHQFLLELEAKYHVIASFDETVSGFINETLNKWVKGQGGQPNNFHPAWVPGYSYFSTDNAILEPTPIQILPDCTDLVREHVAKREANLGRPVYVRNYSTLGLRAKGAGLHLAKALYRRVMRSDTFLDGYAWPNMYHGVGLLRSLYGRYDDLSDLLDPSCCEKYVVFPLHLEPEAVLNYYSATIRQEEIASAILDQLPPGANLILKEHPSQVGALLQGKWKTLRAHKRVRIIRGDKPMQPLLTDRALVCSIGSTAIMDGIIHGITVYVVGDHFIRDLPGIRSITDIRNIGLDWTPQDVLKEDLISFYADFMQKACFEGQFIRNNRSFLDHHLDLFDAVLGVSGHSLKKKATDE